MARVFISYSSADVNRFVGPLVEKLRASGIDAWFAETELRPGDDLVQRIFDEGIGKSDVVVIVLSPASLSSRWVQQELNATVVRRLTHDTRLVPVLLDGVEAPVSITHVVHIRASSDDVGQVAQRIADVAFGVATKESLAEPPIASYVPRIEGLEKIDELLLRAICEQIISGSGHPYVDREHLVAFADSNHFSEDRLEESLSALAHSYYIEEMHELGSRLPFAVKPTNFGFETYLTTYYHDLESTIKNVASAIVNGGHFHDVQISQVSTIPLSIVDYVLELLEARGHVKLVRALDGIYLRPLPTLQRMLP